MKPVSATAFATLGAAIIAMSYGLARFAYGLLCRRSVKSLVWVRMSWGQ